MALHRKVSQSSIKLSICISMRRIRRRCAADYQFMVQILPRLAKTEGKPVLNRKYSWLRTPLQCMFKFGYRFFFLDSLHILSSQGRVVKSFPYVDSCALSSVAFINDNEVFVCRDSICLLNKYSNDIYTN